MSWLTNKWSAANAAIEDDLGWPSEGWSLPVEEVNSKKQRDKEK